MTLDRLQLRTRLESDRELAVRLKTFRGSVRVTLGETVLELHVDDGAVTASDPAPDAGEPTVGITVPTVLWDLMALEKPQLGLECMTSAQVFGATIDADWPTVVAPYLGAWNRIVRLGVETETGRREKVADADPFADSDDPIGRYVRYTVDGLEYRVYYEQAGTGPVPVVLMHTAGADGRQYRHVLADPELQKRYTMIAIDLPYHGKSLPPLGSRWWEKNLKFDKTTLMNWVTGFIAATGLDRPIFVGCSVGGQLASDLCAHHPEAIRGAIGVNGLYHMESWQSFDNDRFRDPRVAAGAVGSTMFDVTGIDAPEDFRREVEWIYTSNHRDVYPADNDYFMFGHDLRIDGHLIDTARTPLTILTGEHDISMLTPDDNGSALAANIPGAEFFAMPGLSHFTPSDDPEGFRPHLTAALDRIAEHAVAAERAVTTS
ncbi:alpha/beta hydrolase [Rhodococcus ruber]|uniref:Alpha/beta hydrolase n=1 Tax=Rhodococcus ruber TaxID=1830 RepID=A0ABT4MD25_9NOCA|nr:alpha/beta hydrolase [Rhodococcus ruber]MCZ4518887.1 alpha/beta hydrolase [Rhodococcus ruber]